MQECKNYSTLTLVESFYIIINFLLWFYRGLGDQKHMGNFFFIFGMYQNKNREEGGSNRDGWGTINKLLLLLGLT